MVHVNVWTPTISHVVFVFIKNIECIVNVGIYDNIIFISRHARSHAVQAEHKMHLRTEEVAKAANKAKQGNAATDDAHGEGPATKGKAAHKSTEGRLAKMNDKLDKDPGGVEWPREPKRT